MKKLKHFARKGFLPKDIANDKTPLCSSCIQVKQTRTSISRMASGDSIKDGNVRSGDKISCDHYKSREPEIMCNTYGKVLDNEHASCGAIFVDHASDFMHDSMQISVEGKQTVEAKHNFEAFAKNCGLSIKHYHADNRIR